MPALSFASQASADGLIVDRSGALRVAFLGRRSAPSGVTPGAALVGLSPPDGDPLSPPSDIAWNRQVHSARVRVVAREVGEARPADALWTAELDLALAIFTADCVPVLIGSTDAAAAVHAGWRGLENGILPNTVERFSEPKQRLTAWIGPAMAACCYEVGSTVGQRVARVSSPDVVVPAHLPSRPRPHLDLAAAARDQLWNAGLRDLRMFDRCTGCRSDEWWSYRRGASKGQRNLAFIWRSAG